jgi:hypothetical protein
LARGILNFTGLAGLAEDLAAGRLDLPRARVHVVHLDGEAVDLVVRATAWP